MRLKQSRFGFRINCAAVRGEIGLCIGNAALLVTKVGGEADFIAQLVAKRPSKEEEKEIMKREEGFQIRATEEGV